MVPQAVRRCITIFTLILGLATIARAQSQVYVLDEGAVPLSCSGHPCYGPTVHLVNAVTAHDLGTIPIAPSGWRGTAVRLSSDGARLFVTSNPYTATGAVGQLSVVDAFTRAVVAQIPVGHGAGAVAILPDNSRAYVVNTNDDTVSVVDLSSFTVVSTVPVQSAPAGIVAAPNGGAVYVTNRGSGTVSKISTTNDVVAATIPAGVGPVGIDVSPDGGRLFVANLTSLNVSVIDAALDSLLRNLPAGTSTNPPIDVAAQSGTRVYALLATPATLISGAASPGSVALLDAATGAVVGSSSDPRALRLVRDSSGSPAYSLSAGGLQRLAADGSSVTAVSPSLAHVVDAAVVTDSCAFEASASATVFGTAGGPGTLTIPAPAGCPWNAGTSGFTGLSVTGTLSGTGPATRAFTLASTTSPGLGTIAIGRQTLTFEQTIPRMNLEVASGTTVQQPFTIGGWAFDENVYSNGTASPDTGVDVVQVWAYPVSGSAPIFAGTATYGLQRPDVAAIYSLKYQMSDFSLTVSNLPTGTYNLVAFAHSSRSLGFSNAQGVTVNVVQAPPRVVIDAPAAGSVRTPFVVAGWAVDPLGSGAGVDVIHVYAYPAAGGPPQLLGQATYGLSRPDVATFLGSSRFTSSGYNLTASLAPGGYTLVVYAHSTATGQFTANTVSITVAASSPLMNIDAPVAGSVGASFTVAGWALDLASGSGSGVDTVHVWAYPVSGPAPLFIGAATRVTRTDVGNAFGGQFAQGGFALTGASLPSGTYDLVVFAHSTVTGTFNNTKVVRITVP